MKNASVNIPNPWFYCIKNLDKMQLKKKDKELLSIIIKKGYIYNNVSIEMLNTRRRPLVETNAVICKVIHQYFRLGYADIGSIFNKHHATIIHYINSYEDVLCLDKKIKAFYNYLVEIINQYKYGNERLERYDGTSKKYQDLVNDYNLLITKYNTVQEQLVKIKCILDD